MAAPRVAEAPEASGGTQDAFDRIWEDPKGFLGALRSINNIPIATKYMIAGFVFFLIGGAQAILMRLQLGTPENTLLDAETYNQLFTMHGTTMMFLFVIPFIEALSNYMLPLVLGTRDMPFPRLTALSFWTYLFGGILLYSSFFFGVAPDGGWFAYVPLNDRVHSPGINMDFWDIGLSVAEVSAIAAAAEVVVAVLRMRAPGMRLHRIPIYAWAMLVTALMILFGFTPLIVATAMLELDRKGLTSFFIPSAGGDPLLWQHLFWVFGHPEVYIMLIPALGIVAQVVQTFSRRAVPVYTLVVLSFVMIGFVSFGLWVHHMFSAGLSPAALSLFAVASMFIAIPAGILTFGWIATLWTGRPRLRVPLLYVLGFIALFAIGGVTGVMLAATPFDLQAHDTHFVVAHFHYILIGGVLFPFFAAIYYWWPKMTGRLMSERLGRWNFWMMFIFINVAFLPMHLTGLRGMPRRVYTYPAGLGWDVTNLISTIGAIGFAIGVLLVVVNAVWSLRKGKRASADPWKGDTLEWSESSPPASAQFRNIPVVSDRHPLWRQRTLDSERSQWARELRPLRGAPTEWRGGLVVSVESAEPRAVVHMPNSTYVPFVTAVGMFFLFAGLLSEHPAPLWIGAAITASGLVRWFWPQRTERIALATWGVAPRDRLPLAIAGPISNGYWGTVILVLALATALVTLIASYFYLADSAPAGHSSGSPLLPRAAAAALVLAAAATIAYARAVRRQAAATTRALLALTTLAHSAALGLTARAYAAMDATPVDNAYLSAVFGLIGFQWLVLALTILMLLVAQIWAWTRPRDPRGDAVALNATLVSHFTVIGGLVVLAVLYLSPLLR
ncbi:MAG TPA: cytochrome c oxidase subunit I [Gemmatimonadaceae bacterium]|jgi:cytochrome c oxidase subunit I+III|nr:cytochrome c oxidase subunit I [Gemmatimonadaceae bacterium]